MKRTSVLGFTLAETLVAIVIGVISVTAIYYSYQFFNKSYKSVIQKSSISKSGRDGLSQIVKELRNAGYKDMNYKETTSNHGGTELTDYLSKTNNAANGGDILKFSYDFSPWARVAIEYKLKKYLNNRSDTFLARTYKFNSCRDQNDPSNLDALVTCKDIEKIIDEPLIHNVEDFQVIFKNDKGIEVSNQALVKSIELYITIKSKDEIFNKEKSWTISNGDGDHTYPKKDKYYRDTFFVSVYPRNILKN
jgi:hypothetical protein|tara:strand:+ start:1409 stop:2155 length:747 start_codon:yes stop_codon:yes gene_type:complete